MSGFLIVDDNQKNLYILQALLEGYGYEVHSAFNGAEALEIARQHVPDMIITDIMMPVMDGFTFCRECKSDEQLKRIPFIFYSATYTDAKDEKLAMALGASRFVVKPVEPAEFYKVIVEVLEEYKEQKFPAPVRSEKDKDRIERMYAETLSKKLDHKVEELGKESDALQKSEQKYRRLVETLRKDYFFYSHGTDGVFTYISPSITNVLGYSQEDFLVHYTKYLTDNPVNSKVEHLTELSLKGEQQPPYEIEIFHGDGSIHWLEVTEVPVFEEDGSVKAVEGIAHDITERKKSELALRLSEEKFSKAFRSSPTFITISTLSEIRFLEVNDAFLEATGYKREEVINHTSSDLDLWADMTDRIKIAKQLREQEAIYNQEMGLNTKTGEILALLFSAEMIDIEGEPCILMVALDITERKKLESQLRHAQKMESIGTLAGGIAHDFNNILTVMVGVTSILKKRMPEDDPLKLFVEQIQTAVDDAANLTHSLLTFSRKQRISLLSTNINDVVSKFEKFLLRIIGEDIELKTILVDDHLNVLADFNQMEQVLMNLAINARDAMPGGGSLTIQTESVNIDSSFIKTHGYGKPGPYALISISDTGAGMNKTTREKIFEPFFTTKEINKGTGLGLSIVYGIIKQHNGYVNVKSEIGEGSTFEIYLPVKTQVKAVIEAEKTAVPEPVGGTETILVAEDDSRIRNIITSILSDFGYKTISANDGEDAVNKFIENKDSIQFVVSDVIMPKKNGKELYKEIKKIKPDTRALFLSGYSRDIIHQRDMLEDGVEIISKPVKPDDLLRKIRSTLDMQ